jgi:RNA polymerase-interacting CarD/CdnL/TRCF family regulator
MDDVEVVEAYVPARLAYLARLYPWLRDQPHNHPQSLVEGFSVYQVGGAFKGKGAVYEEATMVIRMIMRRPAENDGEEAERKAYDANIQGILNELISITERQEEELWVVRTPARRMIG